MIIFTVENSRREFVTTPVHYGTRRKEDGNYPCAEHHYEAAEVGEGFVHWEHDGDILVHTHRTDNKNARHGEQDVDKAIEIAEWFANSLKKGKNNLLISDIFLRSRCQSLLTASTAHLIIMSESQRVIKSLSNDDGDGNDATKQ